jgi:hypothetical protein
LLQNIHMIHEEFFMLICTLLKWNRDKEHK